MSQEPEIAYFNRYTQAIENEKIYGGKGIEFIYENSLGNLLLPIITHPALSKLYGKIQDTKMSAKKVPEFVTNFDINMDEFEKGSIRVNKIEDSYKNFNEFFIRAFKKGKRTFSEDASDLGAPAEGRYFGYSKITNDIKIPVKGHDLTAENLLCSDKYLEHFQNGPLVIARLCPVDYHRYHYPDGGSTVENYNIHGEYHSVNPMALHFKSDIFIKNERRVSILETENFGLMAYIEVGATCVGKIVQSHDESVPHIKGQEKGYFLFGGSTVIVIGEEGKWEPSSDILSNTSNGIETYIRLGDKIN